MIEYERVDLICTYRDAQFHIDEQYVMLMCIRDVYLAVYSHNRVTQALKTIIRQKNKRYRKSIEKPVEYNTVKYKEYEKILKVVLKAALENYYHQLLDESSNSVKKLYKHFGPIHNIFKTRETIWLLC